jgi:hypothetical protein
VPSIVGALDNSTSHRSLASLPAAGMTGADCA